MVTDALTYPASRKATRDLVTTASSIPNSTAMMSLAISPLGSWSANRAAASRTGRSRVVQISGIRSLLMHRTLSAPTRRPVDARRQADPPEPLASRAVDET
jgi:hypothetical protein